jgi:uncharacterized membrane protein HdeD (DUF308 family)
VHRTKVRYDAPVTQEGRALAGKLWGFSLVRGLAAMAVGAWVLAYPPASAGEMTRVIALYWALDGLLVFAGSLKAVSLTVNRVFLLLRSVGGCLTALVLLVLPLNDAFGPYRPGQLMLLLFVVPAVIFAIGMQIVAAVFDLLMSSQVRRRIPGEWSLGLSALISIVFGVLLIGVIMAPPAVLGRGLGAVGIVGGLAVVIGALRLRPAGDPSLSALPH